MREKGRESVIDPQCSLWLDLDTRESLWYSILGDVGNVVKRPPMARFVFQRSPSSFLDG